MGKEQKKESRTIRQQIFSGYSRIILLMFCLVALVLVSLVQIRNDYRAVSNNRFNRDNQASTQSALAKHYAWLEEFNESIQNASTFQGSLDHTTCLLGQWSASVNKKDLADPVIAKALQDIQTPHQQLHAAAGDILDLSKHDRDAAYGEYLEKIKPLATQVIQGLDTISSQYQSIAEDASGQLEQLILILLVVCILGALVVLGVAVFYGNRSARQISKPVTAVAEWSERLSLGADQVKFDAHMLAENKDNEI